MHSAYPSHCVVFALSIRWNLTVIIQIVVINVLLYCLAYHWDTSDWMPSTRLSNIKETPGYELGPGSDVASSVPCSGKSTCELKSDYYLGGFDIDSDYPPTHVEEFLSEDQLPPPLPTGENCPEVYMPVSSKLLVFNECTQSFGCIKHPSQYLPPSQLPFGDITQLDFGTSGSVNAKNSASAPQNMRRSIGICSTSDISTPCKLSDSEYNSDFDTMVELFQGVTMMTDSQQQTEV